MTKQVNELQYDFFKLVEEIECECWSKEVLNQKFEILRNRVDEILKQDNSYFYRLMHEVQCIKELIKSM